MLINVLSNVNQGRLSPGGYPPPVITGPEQRDSDASPCHSVFTPAAAI